MRATLRIDLSDEATADAVHQALLPECAEGPEGSRVELRLEAAVIHAEIEAKDLSTLRAAIHSVLRLLDTAWRTAR